MKKLFTFFALFALCVSAKAVEVVDFDMDYSKQTEIKLFSWGGSESARARLSLQDGCLTFTSAEATDPSWDCQFFPVGGYQVEEGVEYTLTYKIKGDHAANFNFIPANLTGDTPWGNGVVTEEWTEQTFTYTASADAEENFIVQCGDYVGTFQIAWIKVTHEGGDGPKVVLDIPVPQVDFVNEHGTPDIDQWDNPTMPYNDPNFATVCAWTAVKGKDLCPAPIEVVDGAKAFVLHATAKQEQTWDNQFFITAPKKMVAGDSFTVSFDYKADHAATGETQAHAQPSVYNHWQLLDNVSFTEDWQTMTKSVTLSAEQTKNGGFYTIAFNLSVDESANNYYFRNINISGKASEIEEKDGLFIATDKNGQPQEVPYVDEWEMHSIIVGEDSPVGAIWISTKTGSPELFSANSLKFPKEGIVYEEGSFAPLDALTGGKQIVLPSSGAWEIDIDLNAGQFNIFQAPTGIKNVKTDAQSGKSVLYNLAGQVVNDSYKGIVIKDGKKMIQK
ncbi:MAG: hypothetical protein HUK08_02780 [Bacteroidaceae bacterium]|nr:hypothetical protein [Bacteroidaceae bacterium]